MSNNQRSWVVYFWRALKYNGSISLVSEQWPCCSGVCCAGKGSGQDADAASYWSFHRQPSLEPSFRHSPSPVMSPGWVCVCVMENQERCGQIHILDRLDLIIHSLLKHSSFINAFSIQRCKMLTAKAVNTELLRCVCGLRCGQIQCQISFLFFL